MTFYQSNIEKYLRQREGNLDNIISLYRLLLRYGILFNSNYASKTRLGNLEARTPQPLKDTLWIIFLRRVAEPVYIFCSVP